MMKDDEFQIFNTSKFYSIEAVVEEAIFEQASPLIGNSEHSRASLFLEHPVFNTYHSEQQLVR